MTKYRQKNLMVDEEAVPALAQRRGLSEWAAVREAVDNALLAEEFETAMRELAALGRIDDVFSKLSYQAGRAVTATSATTPS